MVILSLAAPRARAAASLLADPPAGCGAVEARLDLLGSPDPTSLVSRPWRRRSLPRIATCRRRGEGGEFAGPESERLRLLARALEAGFHLADVEAGAAIAGPLLQRHPGRVILSHHDRKRTSAAGDLIDLYRRMASKRGVAVVKIVTTARDAVDILEVRRLLKLAARRRSVPLMAFAMGEYGRASRILACSWGSWGTFACLDEASRTGEGQITLDEAARLYRVDSIDAGTRLAAITGDPVSHSLSPLIHNVAYERLDLNRRYLPLAVRDPESLPDLIRGLPLEGLSVTAPHKIAAARIAAVADPLVRRAGAANTLVVQRGRIHAWNTDVEGVRVPLRRRIDPLGRRALVLGSGGAARAAALALADCGAEVVVASRSRAEGAALARLVGGRWIPFRAAGAESCEILINATPTGSDGRSCPVPRRMLRGLVVGDLVYRPGQTPLVRMARSRGLAAFGGEEVLLAQALRQFALFTGREAPERAMRSALDRALEGKRRGRSGKSG